MKFKYSAFIENTPEMREWLVRLGYTLADFFNSDLDLIFTNESGVYGTFRNTPMEIYRYSSKEEVIGGRIDFLGNPDLFKAVTAIREDSDKWQLFTDGVKWTLCYEESILMWRDIYNFPDKNLIHKATLSELKEHFNKGK